MMRQLFILITLLISFILPLELTALLQHIEPTAPSGKLYDVQAVETVFGHIVSIEKVNSQGKRGYSVALLLQTPTGVLHVHLGPTWFMESTHLTLALRDRIEVKGSRIVFQGEQVILAAEVKKDSEVLKLRDEKGAPLWSGWRGAKR